MAESPTREEILEKRPDLESVMEDNDANLDIDDYISRALTDVKRDLREIKGIKWDMVYDSDEDDYFTDTDGDENNRDSIINMIIMKTISEVFKDFATAVEDSRWWDLHIAYRQDYEESIRQAKLDIDRDESGEITDDEENQDTQNFFRG